MYHPAAPSSDPQVSPCRNFSSSHPKQTKTNFYQGKKSSRSSVSLPEQKSESLKNPELLFAQLCRWGVSRWAIIQRSGFFFKPHGKLFNITSGGPISLIHKTVPRHRTFIIWAAVIHWCIMQPGEDNPRWQKQQMAPKDRKTWQMSLHPNMFDPFGVNWSEESSALKTNISIYNVFITRIWSTLSYNHTPFYFSVCKTKEVMTFFLFLAPSWNGLTPKIH